MDRLGLKERHIARLHMAGQNPKYYLAKRMSKEVFGRVIAKKFDQLSYGYFWRISKFVIKMRVWCHSNWKPKLP